MQSTILLFEIQNIHLHFVLLLEKRILVKKKILAVIKKNYKLGKNMEVINLFILKQFMIKEFKKRHKNNFEYLNKIVQRILHSFLCKICVKYAQQCNVVRNRQISLS